MKNVYIIADNLTTPLGCTTEENISQMIQGISGIRKWPDFFDPSADLYAARMGSEWENKCANASSTFDQFTPMEQMFFWSIDQALNQSSISLSDERTLLILSTTKGNIDLLDKKDDPNYERRYLGKMGRWLKQKLNCTNPPLIVSNACISGVLAILVGSRLIRQGRYDHVVVSGGDLVTPFVVSGFQSFKAISSTPCRPYDQDRSGISLGEGCGTVILSSNPQKGEGEQIEVLSGATSNDSNHISGPSRTGEGLLLAIKQAFKYSGRLPKDIDYISTHGTATLYNDEMEAKALSQANLEKVPLSSLKGYFGHTLGAAGVIESIVSIHSLKKNTLFANLGYESHGVSIPINVIRKNTEANLKHCLKTASGFGGCNAALIFAKS